MEKRKRRKRDNSMAWDYPLFRKRYQRNSNPDVEPTKLLKDDESTVLTYRYPDGRKIEYTAKQFFEEKLCKQLPAVSDGIMMAWDYPEFRTLFQVENNPDIDPRTLRKKDKMVEIHYTNPYGLEFTFYADNFFSNRLWEKYPYKHYEMAMDYKEFRDIFQQEHNPGIDPYTIRKWDNDIRLIYENPYGITISYTADRFFLREMWKTMPFRRLEMAMDYPEFVQFFQQEHNPGVDPYTIRKWDNTKRLYYINKHGRKIPFYSSHFFSYRLWETMEERRYEMAMDYKEFSDKFQQENNPEINPYDIRKNETDISLLYVNQYGDKVTFTPWSFFHRQMWVTLDEKHYEMAMDYKEFVDTFQQEHNPGVDPYTIRKWDNITELYHVNQNGVKIPYTAHKFFVVRLWEIFPNKTGNMAMDYPEFRKVFQQERNPLIDPYLIGKWDKEPELKYLNPHGIEVQYTSFNFFNNRMWETMSDRRISNEKRRDGKYEMAMDYPEFASFFQPENNPGIDPYTLKKWRDYTPLIHINQYGVVTPYTPHYFFHKRIWKYVPYRQYKPGETVNALELDEDIALYVKTEKDKEKLVNTGVHTSKAFQCPFCGNEFSKRLVEMINCSPKCPFCSDSGMYVETDDEEINGAFLKHT